MATTNSSAVLSCNDSPLSIASATAGFITLAYAIAVGLFIYVQRAYEAPARLFKLERAMAESEYDVRRCKEIVDAASSFQNDSVLNSDRLFHRFAQSMREWRKHSLAFKDGLSRASRFRRQTKWRILRATATYSLLAENMETGLKRMEAASAEISAIAHELESRMQDQERLEQNAMLVNIWERLKKVEAQQETIGRHMGASDGRTEQPRDPVSNPKEEDVVASLMRPRRQGTGLGPSRVPTERLQGALESRSENIGQGSEKS